MKKILAKTILSKIKPDNSFWFGLDYTMNLYRGCCHGCIYCDSRSDCYHIESFDQVCLKENALLLLEQELQRKRNTGVVASGAMSDPYNPFEIKQCITRSSLRLLNQYQFGCSVATKSDLITRDIDLFTQIKKHSPVLCKITITTIDDSLCRKIEPYVAVSSKRFSAIEALATNNIFSGILLMPVLPFLEDNPENITRIVERAAQVGAKFIYADFGVTLRDGQREYFFQQLNSIFPDKNYAKKYKDTYKLNYHCASPRYEKLWDLFAEKCEKYGILYKMPAIISAYKKEYGNEQISFL